MRIADFGYADFSAESKLQPLWTEKDVVNGPSEYVLIFNYKGRDYLVTRGENKGKSRIIVNEIACDFRPNINEMVFYYPKRKSTECRNFERLFNIELFKDEILSGRLDINKIKIVLGEINIKDIVRSPLDRLFVGSFREDKKSGDEYIELFGLKKNLFDGLKRIREQNKTTYQVTMELSNNKKR